MKAAFTEIRWIFDHAFTRDPIDALVTPSGLVRCIFGDGKDARTLDWTLSETSLDELSGLLSCVKADRRLLPTIVDGPVGALLITFQNGTQLQFDATEPIYKLVENVLKIRQHDPRRLEESE